MTVLDLPPMPDSANPIVLPGLVSGLGLVTRTAPAWITDPNVIASIAAGLVEIDDDFMALDEPTLPQIRKRITGWLCFYVLAYRVHAAHLEQRVADQRAGLDA